MLPCATFNNIHFCNIATEVLFLHDPVFGRRQHRICEIGQHVHELGRRKDGLQYLGVIDMVCFELDRIVVRGVESDVVDLYVLRLIDVICC